MVEISCYLYKISVKFVLKAKLYFTGRNSVHHMTVFFFYLFKLQSVSAKHVQSCVAIRKIQEAIYHNFNYNTYMISTKVVKDNAVGLRY